MMHQHRMLLTISKEGFPSAAIPPLLPLSIGELGLELRSNPNSPMPGNINANWLFLSVLSIRGLGGNHIGQNRS